MRKRMFEEEKKKNISVAINPDIYSLFGKYCEINDISSKSEFIEKLIIKKLNKLI